MFPIFNFRFFLFACFVGIFAIDAWLIAKAIQGWNMLDIRIFAFIAFCKAIQYCFFYAWKHVRDTEEV